MPKAADDPALGSGLLASDAQPPRERNDIEPVPALPRCLQFSRLSRGQAVLAAAGVAVLALAPIVAVIELKGADRSCAEDIDCGGNGHCDDATSAPDGPAFNPTAAAPWDVWHANLNCAEAGFDGGDCDNTCAAGQVQDCDGGCVVIPDPPTPNPLGDGAPPPFWQACSSG